MKAVAPKRTTALLMIGQEFKTRLEVKQGSC